MNSAPLIVSMGACTCAGHGAEKLWNAVLEGRPLFGRQTIFDSPRFGNKKFGVAPINHSWLEHGISNCGCILLSALDEALENLNLPRGANSGIFFGTSIGGVLDAENMLAKYLNRGGVPDIGVLGKYECSYMAEFVAKRLGCKGACSTFSTACSSSGIAIAEACEAISSGELELAVVCGADSLSRTTVNGFGSLMLLSDSDSRPFDANRDGINLGEGAGVIVLASESFAYNHSLKPIAHISGWGLSADAYHATAPRPDGDGAARAMKLAVELAGISPKDISFYCAHGTGTRGNDLSEAQALRSVFGDVPPPFSSIKGVVGHTLGASGVLNVIVSAFCASRSIIPPSAGFRTVDPQIGLSPVGAPIHAQIEHVLSASFGFGGNNSCAVVSRRGVRARPEIRHGKTSGVYVFGSHEIGGNGAIDASGLLKDIPQLKKRKWAKLQQMALEVARPLELSRLSERIDTNRIGVCWGTGLGMTDEIEKFLTATIKKRESEPIPTSFVNSVHNAPPSLLAMHFGFKGLNSAATAGEISFECALKQAFSSLRTGKLDAVLACAGDMANKWADDFARYRRDSSAYPSSDYSAAHLLGGDLLMSGMRPKFRIIGVFNRARASTPKAERDMIAEDFKRFEFDLSKIDAFFSLPPVGKFARKFSENLQSELGYSFKMISPLSDNYSKSGGIFCAADRTEGRYFAHWNLSSTGFVGILIFERV